MENYRKETHVHVHKEKKIQIFKSFLVSKLGENKMISEIYGASDEAFFVKIVND